MTKKSSKNVLTLVQKYKILDKLKYSDTIASLARKFEMNVFNIWQKWKNEETIWCSITKSALISNKTCFITCDVIVRRLKKTQICTILCIMVNKIIAIERNVDFVKINREDRRNDNELWLGAYVVKAGKNYHNPERTKTI